MLKYTNNARAEILIIISESFKIAALSFFPARIIVNANNVSNSLARHARESSFRCDKYSNASVNQYNRLEITTRLEISSPFANSRVFYFFLFFFEFLTAR